ncbi:MAG TPA: hypothetical protein PK954_01230, partial [Anaerolineales bacterium]|nr:hypothetical protein [Anaerolineales bacterium]
ARALTVENTIKACAVETDPPTLRDLRSDLGRVTDAIESAYGLRHLAVEPSVIRQLSPTARTHNWNLTAFIH